MWFLYLFIGQVIVAAFVVMFLRRMLEDMLIDTAIRQFDYWISTEGKDAERKTIFVCSLKPLKSIYTDRIRKAISRSWGEEGNLSFSMDPGILGGLIIQTGVKRFDYSLRDRLRQACLR